MTVEVVLASSVTTIKPLGKVDTEIELAFAGCGDRLGSLYMKQTKYIDYINAQKVTTW